MHKLRVCVVFGTRPEAIKVAPVIMELSKYPNEIETVACVTAQHRKMLDQVLSIFNIKPDIDLDLMEENQSLDSLTANAVRALTKTFIEINPNIVLVQGDTTTAMVAALAAFYRKIPVGHIEAGLRTKDCYNPFPEEINRHLISVLATYHFAPTRKAADSLLREGVCRESVFLTGNTVVDALRMIVKNIKDINNSIANNSRMILVTAHRRESFGEPIRNICAALKSIVKRNKDVEIVYPVHMNPNIKEPVYNILSGQERIRLREPLEYSELVKLLYSCHMVLTDSGGIQEEAPTFGKPVLVLREETERPEGIEAGVAKLVGTDRDTIVREAELLLNDEKEYFKMAKAVSPYGDGSASERIVEIIKDIRRSKTDEFSISVHGSVESH